MGSILEVRLEQWRVPIHSDYAVTIVCEQTTIYPKFIYL